MRTFDGPVHYDAMEHISDNDLERYHLGMVNDEAELGIIEEHLLFCERCVDTAEKVAGYVDLIRAASAEAEWGSPPTPKHG